MNYSNLNKEQLLDLFISYIETAYYHHDSTEQYEAETKVETIKEIVLDRMT
jgi:hypothetical protein